MLEFDGVASSSEEVLEQKRVVTVQNDGRFSLTQLWEVILRNKRLPGKRIQQIPKDSNIMVLRNNNIT